MLVSFNRPWKAITSSFLHRYQYIQFRLRYIGLVGLIGYPLFYFMYQNWFPQYYDSLPLRLIASLFCIPLVFIHHWPKSIQRFQPLYTYIVFLYSLSFLFTYMLLRNNANDIWLMSGVLAFFFMLLLVDWLNVIIMYVIGFALAYIALILSSGDALIPITYLASLPILILALIGYALFDYSENLIQYENQQTLKRSANLAHEMRTPLMTIKAIAVGLQKYLPTLLNTYEKAMSQDSSIPNINAKKRQLLKKSAHQIENEINYTNNIINILLTSLYNQADLSQDYQLYSMHKCVTEALSRYPFKTNESKKISHIESEDFYFYGSDSLLINVLFNLLNNSLYAITKVEKGDISIWLKQTEQTNYLYFKDTAVGIPPEILPHIFEDFFTSKGTAGTGIGLPFSKRVINSFGGDLTCETEENKYALFILSFPSTDKVTSS